MTAVIQKTDILRVTVKEQLVVFLQFVEREQRVYGGFGSLFVCIGWFCFFIEGGNVSFFIVFGDINVIVDVFFLVFCSQCEFGGRKVRVVYFRWFVCLSDLQCFVYIVFCYSFSERFWRILREVDVTFNGRVVIIVL